MIDPTFSEVFQLERDRQDEVWGKNRHLQPTRIIRLLGEEMVEVAEAAGEHDLKHYIEELVQLGALVVFALEQIRDYPEF